MSLCVWAHARAEAEGHSAPYPSTPAWCAAATWYRLAEGNYTTNRQRRGVTWKFFLYLGSANWRRAPFVSLSLGRWQIVHSTLRARHRQKLPRAFSFKLTCTSRKRYLSHPRDYKYTLSEWDCKCCGIMLLELVSALTRHAGRRVSPRMPATG